VVRGLEIGQRERKSVLVIQRRIIGKQAGMVMNCKNFDQAPGLKSIYDQIISEN